MPRRIAVVLSLAWMLALLHAPPALAARSLLNGVEIPGAFLHENRIYVSLRTFASLVRGRLFWDPVERAARLFLPGRSATFWAERRQALVNSEPLSADAAPVVRAGVLFVPLASLAEAAGGSITWDEAGRTAAATIPWLEEPGPAIAPPDDALTGSGQQPSRAEGSAFDQQGAPASRGFIYDASPGEIDLLARLIEAEARSEPYRGMVAVGAVVLNRVRSAPDATINSVVRSGCQFTVVCSGRIDRIRASEEARRAALDALRGKDPTGGAIYFNAARAARGGFWDKLRSRGWREVRIGRQVFFAPPR